ncbi:GAF domain-containing protein [Pseudomonas sp. RAC1]|uniref:GAF domain-containing protein n=1 Tax=Pseudomonas sp. RAC1 TaxID=3064900 RepID=UPI0004072F5C|nr:GAF domain-containing protein [Pseudomonas sp. RAC1]MDV9030986.1 GAF domain-containing protein [Pseudomonas sp. RAC1]
MHTQTLELSQYLSQPERNAIAEIEATTSILRLVTRITRMKFAAIAKFNEDEWLTCSVHDPDDIGPDVGESVPIETTICDEFRTLPSALLIPSISEVKRFAQKPIVRQYNLESYAGVPIFLPDGRLYGALCALDITRTALDDPDLAETLTLFSRLIGCIFYNNLQQDADEPSMHYAR